MKYYDVVGKEISYNKFISIRDMYIQLFGNAFFEATSTEYKLLDPLKVHMVIKR